MSALIRVDQNGLPYAKLRDRVLAGDLRRVRRGRYAAPDADADLAVRAAAAVSRLNGDPVASHVTAAALWGIPVLGPADERVHLTRTRRGQGTNRSYPDLVVHHAALPPHHVTAHRGVRVTTPARTVADLARLDAFRAGVVAADAVLRRRLCAREDLLCVALDCAGWPGVRRVRAVARFADPASGSPLESISRVAFAEFGLPDPRPQAPIGVDVVDFLWQEYRVVGEADGLAKYTDAAVLRKEKLRQERIAQLGYHMVRWTWREAYRRPDTVAYRVLDALRRHGYPH